MSRLFTTKKELEKGIKLFVLDEDKTLLETWRLSWKDE